MLEQIFHDWRGLILFAVNIAFIIGIYYAKIKSFLTSDEIKNMIENEGAKLKKDIDDRLDNLKTAICEKVTDNEKKVNILSEWKDAHTAWGTKENEQNHLKLQEITINLKNLCEKSGVKYHTLNNGK